LRSLSASQCFLEQRKSLLLFDEAEDIFNDGSFTKSSTAQTRKAWINNMLENNKVPVLWISNSIDLDPAFIRRFDMVIELPVPPKLHRTKIVKSVCGDMISNSSLKRMAEVENLSPAVISRAASVIRCIEDNIEKPKLSSSIEFLVSNTLEAQGHRPININDPNRISEIYDPTFINADTDLKSISMGLASSKAGRICLYGPPGTGKTAYARWLADQLEIPILVKRGSDLLSKWIGGTEEEIARAFKEAEQEKALLLIDEVDSFLQDRRGAQRSWEITAVNEMLIQLESFSGIFVASTNLMENLDQAAMRRFDLKIKFDYLKHDQAWNMLIRQSEVMGLTLPTPVDHHNLNSITVLTPGDFATVTRQHRFRPIKSSAELVNALKNECTAKEDGKKSQIGFH
jgi:SpoVK/Ycf46/Vps4 family AAA+-type ATPase